MKTFRLEKGAAASFALALWTGAAMAGAEELNPTVEVTNLYERQALWAGKPPVPLDLPDSAGRFDVDMRYAVRDVPYGGAYGFSPYAVQLLPEAYDAHPYRLWLRAGAGYALHPEADVVWSPVLRGATQWDVYGHHHSFWGKYWDLRQRAGQPDVALPAVRGAESFSQVGTALRQGWRRGALRADACFHHVLGREEGLGTRSNRSLHLGLEVDGQTGRESVGYAAGLVFDLTGGEAFFERHLCGHAALEWRHKAHRMGVDVGLQMVSRSAGTALIAQVRPRYLWQVERIRVKLGLLASYLYCSQGSPLLCPSGQSDFLFPDAHLLLDAIPGVLTLVLSATGDDKLYVHSEQMRQNAFLPFFQDWEVVEHSVERLHVFAGFRGGFLGCVHYDVRAGVALRKQEAGWGAVQGEGGEWLPALAFLPNHWTPYVHANLGYRSDNLEVELDGKWRKPHTFAVDSSNAPARVCLAPAAFEGAFHLRYFWGEGRIAVGLSLEGMGARRAGEALSVPGFVDLGLQGRVRLWRELAVWLRAGNLLGQACQRIPFHAPWRPWVTLGVSWGLEK